MKKIKIPKITPRKNRFIGLDIGCSSIKLAEFVREEGKLFLTALKLQEVASGAQVAALKKLFEGIDLRQVRLSVVINCDQSCTKILTLPFMPQSEIAEALKWEIKNAVSFSVDEAAMDYELLREVTEAGVKKLRVAVACSPAQTIDESLDLLKQAGAMPSVFTHPAFALKNVISGLSSDGNKTIAILDIGRCCAELFIFQGDELSFSRKLPVAGRDFTQALTSKLMSEVGELQLDLEEAEYIKRKYGIPDANTSEVLEDSITSTELLGLIRPNLEKLSEEIGRSFNFYQEKSAGASPERLILLGGGSNLKNLAKNLSEKLGIAVELGNPLKGLTFKDASLLKDNSQRAHMFAQAAGAALSKPDTLNLLPVEIKEETRLLIKRSTIKALVTAVVVVLILIYAGMEIKLVAHNKRIAAAELELNALRAQTRGLEKKTFLDKLLRERIYCSDVLKEIGNNMPVQIRLSSIELRAKRFSIKGEVRSSDKAEEKVITDFMNLLQKGIFEEVSLVSSKKGLSGSEPYTFELGLTVK
ncbi:MAG: pilus assembly protein PilM [Candidatus Omnitrophota bacterium]|nr:MAG: pilus assembly protein PilM [Candidatus Omnitrophota bacterium]